MLASPTTSQIAMRNWPDLAVNLPTCQVGVQLHADGGDSECSFHSPSLACRHCAWPVHLFMIGPSF